MKNQGFFCSSVSRTLSPTPPSAVVILTEQQYQRRHHEQSHFISCVKIPPSIRPSSSWVWRCLVLFCVLDPSAESFCFVGLFCFGELETENIPKLDDLKILLASLHLLNVFIWKNIPLWKRKTHLWRSYRRVSPLSAGFPAGQHSEEFYSRCAVFHNCVLRCLKKKSPDGFFFRSFPELHIFSDLFMHPESHFTQRNIEKNITAKDFTLWRVLLLPLYLCFVLAALAFVSPAPLTF